MHGLILALQQRGFWHHDMFGMGWHWGWWLFWIVVAALVIWAVTRTLAASGERRPGPGAGEPDAKEILRRRFAEGELTEEEFREKLRALRESE